MNIIDKIFGTYSEKEIKKIIHIVDAIEGMEQKYANYTDSELANCTVEFKQRISSGEKLEQIMPEAYAVVREASKRVLDKRPFRVQLIGGIILHQGRIAEMKTGEGKTIVATFPAYLNALTGKGVHIVTVNDYLATFHSCWMGKLYKFLGLTVGLVVAGMNSEEKKKAYNCDITYGTNNEYGFDYLRDNMCVRTEDIVQRELNYAIIDEVDSILIDEARTPLIISGQGDKSTELYVKTDKLIKGFTPRIIVDKDTKEFDEKDEEFDYVVDLKSKTVSLTERGTKKCEQYFGIESLSDVNNMEISHHVNQALKAHGIMKRDIDYIEKNGEILIVDEFTGRIMQGRRYSDGLHQAIEAKEKVNIASESKTMATITFQNYFRLYSKLSGMTGTAKSEEQEFKGIFGLDVVEIPTNKPAIRVDHNDMVYSTVKGKYDAIVADVVESYKKGQPVLVGTVSIEKSEILSKLLTVAKIPHEVLNAKYHEKEAQIIAQAGQYKAVTIATNMAGRGTDIILGGNAEFLAKKDLEKLGASIEEIEQAISPMPTEDGHILELRRAYDEAVAKYNKSLAGEREKVIQAGGLKIIGSERHESRRIDNQLRGRSGRQGDIGESRFYISLEDDLMKLFGGDKILSLATAMNLPENMPIEYSMITKSIETAQKRVEGRNYSIRKNVLEYDDVMNKQRDIIYAQRKTILMGKDIHEVVNKMIQSRIRHIVNMYITHAEDKHNIDIDEVNAIFENTFGMSGIIDNNSLQMDAKELIIKISGMAESKYNAKRDEFEKKGMLDAFNAIERYILLRTVDDKWQTHIDDMAHLKEGIFLRAYAQTNPVEAYKVESFDLFNQMTASIQEDAVKAVFTMNYKQANDRPAPTISMKQQNFVTNNETKRNPVSVKKEVGRNDPCPCGSGKKYKQCCGK